MKNELNEKSITHLAKLKLTSALSNKDLKNLFNIKSDQIRELDIISKNEIEINDSDLIYGALRSFPKLKSVIDIQDFISLRNKTVIELVKIEKELKKLEKSGIVFNIKGKWNYNQRLIESYSKETDEFIQETELANFDLKGFKEVFKPKNSDPKMFNAYPISKTHKIFDGNISVEFNFDKYSYYLMCRQGE